MIKHFPKWLELVLLQNCTNERVTYAFLDRVFDGFGVLTKVFTNQGIKLYGKFQELCEKTFDHHTTSWDYTKGDEITKWMVQMVKLSLQKYGLRKGQIRKWDL